MDASLLEERIKFASQNGVEPCSCKRCGRYMDAVDRVRKYSRKVKGRRMVSLHASSLCARCAKVGTVERQQERQKAAAELPKVDFTTLAEETLFPGIPYWMMTPLQRRWCYVVARTWWLSHGYGRLLNGFDEGAEQLRLESITASCAKQGIDPTIPPFPDAEDHA